MTGQYRDTAGCTKADSRGGWIMKKAILCLSAALLMAAFSAAAAAAPTVGAPQNIVQQIRTADGQQGAAVEKNAQRPRVVVMYVNNAKSTYDAAVDKEIFKYINKALPADTYELMDGTPYVQKLNAQGYTDLSTAERADFMLFLGIELQAHVIKAVDAVGKGSIGLIAQFKPGFIRPCC